MADLADAMGWYSVPVPDLAVDATAEVVSRLPVPAAASWIHSVRKPVLMKTDRARKLLGWKPAAHGQGHAQADGGGAGGSASPTAR